MMRSEYDLRRKFLVHAFRQMGLECFEPKGAFYVFPSIKSLGMNSEEFCNRLLEEERVAVVPELLSAAAAKVISGFRTRIPCAILRKQSKGSAALCIG